MAQWQIVEHSRQTRLSRGIEDGVILIMDAFIFLQMEHERIEQQLDEFIESFDQMTNEKRFECTSLIFDEIKKHFTHQQSLLSRSSDDVAEFLTECSKDQNDIVEAMNDLLMSHVDDLNFGTELRKLSKSFDVHLKHYRDKLFVQYREQLSTQELRCMDSQVTDWMLGSTPANRFQ